MVCRWPQSLEGDWSRPHLCKLARHGPCRNWFIRGLPWSIALTLSQSVTWFSLQTWSTLNIFFRLVNIYYYCYTRLTASFPGQPGYAGTRKVKPVWIEMRHEMMGFWDGSGISWTACKQSAPRSRQITTLTPHQSFLQARCSSWTPTNSVKAHLHKHYINYSHTSFSFDVSISIRDLWRGKSVIDIERSR